MDQGLKKTTPGMQLLLYVAGFLVLSVGISLFFLAEKTDVYFSWTINPPLTATFLGAGYLASFLLEFLSARESIWARTRPAVPGVWVFTFLTMMITLIHLERFHFDSPRFITKAGTWVWLAVYISVPIAMGILWVIQIRRPGDEPRRENPLPAWMRGTLFLQGALLIVFGSAMLLLPEMMIPFWPWKLSILTSQAIGAWGVGIGILAVQSAWENDWGRLYPFMVSYALYGALQLVNLMRYPATLNWSQASSGVYTVFLVTVLLAGVYGTWISWRIKHDGASL
ncbi:MAG: hypothetical protein KC421_13390 [Anaerolineales bacterium]|nr:hypothetical protein [Anaerolineales bacterium]